MSDNFKIYITSLGDSSVGIPPEYATIELTGKLALMAEPILKDAFEQDLKEAFGEFWDSYVYVDFDFECVE